MIIKLGRRIIVFTLGFNATAVMARINEIAVQAGEEFVFLVPAKGSDRSENTILTIQQFINSVNIRGQKIIYERISVKENSTEEAIQAVYDKLSVKKGHFIFDLSGGFRVLVLIAYTVAQLLRNRVDEVSLRVEDSNEKVTMPLLDLAKPTEAEIRILEEINTKRECTQRKMAHSIDRKISSVSRILTDLEARGLINKRDGKPSIYNLTNLGSLILKWQQDRILYQ
jgi:CRISPR locus-related DNA-binding protein